MGLGLRMHQNYQMGCPKSEASVLNPLELDSLSQSLRTRELTNRPTILPQPPGITLGHPGLFLRGCGDCDAPAPAAPSVLEDLAPTPGRVSLSEPVGAESADIMWLISAFHWGLYRECRTAKMRGDLGVRSAAR